MNFNSNKQKIDPENIKTLQQTQQSTQNIQKIIQNTQILFTTSSFHKRNNSLQKIQNIQTNQNLQSMHRTTSSMFQLQTPENSNMTLLNYPQKIKQDLLNDTGFVSFKNINIPNKDNIQRYASQNSFNKDILNNDSTSENHQLQKTKLMEIKLQNNQFQMRNNKEFIKNKLMSTFTDLNFEQNLLNKKIQLQNIKSIHNYNEDNGEQIPKFMQFKNLQKQKEKKSFCFFWEDYKDESQIITPYLRHGATLTAIGSKLYLYGGVGNKIHQDFYEFNTIKKQWKVLKQKGEIPTVGRIGHTMLTWQNKLVMYGGESDYVEIIKKRPCYGDVRIYNVQLNEWSNLNFFGELVESRRNHSATIIYDKYMLIYGGINNNQVYLNNICVLNLESCKWEIYKGDNDQNKNGIAFHTIKFVSKGDVKRFNIFQPYEPCNQTHRKFIQEDGVYCFGGRDKQGNYSNQIQVLKLGNKIPYWKHIETHGVSPKQRCQHSMDLYDALNLLVIFGGKSNDKTLGDVQVLNLENLCWYFIPNDGLKNLERNFHASSIIQSQYFIFGGINVDKFSSGLIALEMDNKVAAMKKKNADYVAPVIQENSKKKIGFTKIIEQKKEQIKRNSVEKLVKQPSYMPKPKPAFLKMQNEQIDEQENNIPVYNHGNLYTNLKFHALEKKKNKDRIKQKKQ